MNHTAAGVRANDAAAGLRHSRGPLFMVPMRISRMLKLSMNRRTYMPLLRSLENVACALAAIDMVLLRSF